MIFGYAERIATKSPDCRQLRCSLALKTGRTNEFLKLQLPIFKSQEAQTDLTGSLNHNLRALKPHYHILVGIGSTVHLDAYARPEFWACARQHARKYYMNFDIYCNSIHG